jgi:hypothetical protein
MTQPSPTDPTIGTDGNAARQLSRPLSRYSWAKLIARVFETDPLQCGRCGGRIKIIAFVIEPCEIKQILTHVGLPTETPKFHSARGPPQSDLWLNDLWDNAAASEWDVDAT